MHHLSEGSLIISRHNFNMSLVILTNMLQNSDTAQKHSVISITTFFNLRFLFHKHQIANTLTQSSLDENLHLQFDNHKYIKESAFPMPHMQPRRNWSSTSITSEVEKDFLRLTSDYLYHSLHLMPTQGQMKGSHQLFSISWLEFPYRLVSPMA